MNLQNFTILEDIGYKKKARKIKSTTAITKTKKIKWWLENTKNMVKVWIDEC